MRCITFIMRGAITTSLTTTFLFQELLRNNFIFSQVSSMENFTITLILFISLLIAFYFLRKKKFDSSSIYGKRVLVTGASSGIGEQVAYRYAELGAKIVITARRSDLLNKVAKNCKAKGCTAVFTETADMASPEDRIKVSDAVEKLLGGLDILILNHAMLDVARWNNTAENMTSLEQEMNLNFISYVDISSRLSNSLEKSRGCIGVLSSILGKCGYVGQARYCSSKHALQGFYAALRQEFRAKKSGVSITLMVFGPVASEHAIELAKTYTSTAKSFLNLAGRTEDAADVLVRSVAQRQREIYFPLISKLFIIFFKFFPNVIENCLNGT